MKNIKRIDQWTVRYKWVLRNRNKVWRRQQLYKHMQMRNINGIRYNWSSYLPD